MLKERILTALVLVPIVLAAVFYASKPVFAGFIGVFLVLGAWEWGNLARMNQGLRIVFTAGAALLMLLWYMNEGTVRFAEAVIVMWLVALALVAAYPRLGHFTRNLPVMWLLGYLLLLPTWFCVVQLRELGFLNLEGKLALFYVLLLIWGADTGAYFAGRAFGKHKLAPDVSPGKSIEGLLGGVVLTMLLAWFVSTRIEHPDMERSVLLASFFGLSLVTVLVSVVGDLFESLLKREREIKDSSNILPGHGGILDRIDSVTAAVPVFVSGVILLNLQ